MSPDLAASAAGLVAAVLWGTGDFSGGVAARHVRVFVALLGAQGLGLAGAIAGMILTGEAPPTPADALWAGAAGVVGVLGMAGLYRALAVGRMGIVAPITGILTAALPVAVGFAADGLPGPVRLVGFGLGFAAILMVSIADDGTTGRGGIALALGAGISFGLYSTCLGQVRDGVLAPLVVSRGTSVALVLLLVLATRTPIRIAPRWLPVVGLAGALDLGGNGAYLVAVQTGGIALGAVLGSLYPVVTVGLASLLLREPIGRVHAVGVATAALAAAIIIGG